MGQRQKDWARRARLRLIEQLGGVCVECGTDKKLEFDCIKPMGDSHHRMESSARMSFYHAQHRASNLQLLCERHNNLKSAKERENQPF